MCGFLVYSLSFFLSFFLSLLYIFLSSAFFFVLYFLFFVRPFVFCFCVFCCCCRRWRDGEWGIGWKEFIVVWRIVKNCQPLYEIPLGWFGHVFRDSMKVFVIVWNCRLPKSFLPVDRHKMCTSIQLCLMNVITCRNGELGLVSGGDDISELICGR